MKQLFIILFSCFGFLSIAQNNNMRVSFPHNIEKNVRLVIVGVSDYSKIKNLEYADKDARLMFNIFSKMKNIKKENILYLENSNANKYNLLFKLYAFIKESNAGDRLIFYFAGHGDVSTKDDNNGFLLLHDAAKGGYYSVSDALRINNLEKLSQIAIKKNIQIFIITDACRSGTLIGKESGRKRTLLALNEEWKNVFKMVSCDPEQLSFEGKRWGNGHGVFTFYLSEALTGKADNNNDKKLILGELHGYVRTGVTNDTEYKQIPMVTGNESETFFRFDKQSNFNYDNILQKPGNYYYYNVSPKDNLLLQTFIKDLETANFFTDSSEIEEQKWFVDKITYRNRARGTANDLLLIDTKIYTCTDKKVISSFSAINLDQLYDIYGHRGGVLCLADDNKNILASGAWDNSIILWSMETDKFIKQIPAHKDDVRSLKFNDDGSLLASGSDDKKVKVWNIPDGSLTYECIGHKDRVTSLFFLNDKTLISGGRDHRIIVWNLQREQSYNPVLSPNLVLNQHNSEINDMKLSPGKSFFVSGDEDGNLIIWSTLSLKPIKIFSNLLPSIKTIAIDKNSRYILVAGKSKNIKIIDADKLTIDNTIPTGNTWIKKIVLSPNNKKMILLTGTNEIQSYSISIPQPDISSAWGKFRLLVTKPGLVHLEERMKADFARTLMDTVQNTIEPFVAGNNILPNLSQINFALKCVDYIQNLYDENDIFITDKLMAARYLLNIYTTIVSENIDNVADAIGLTEKIKKMAPYAAYPDNILVKLRTQINELTKAKKSAEIAISKNPEWAESYKRKGETLFEEGKYDEAIKTFNKIIEKEPESDKGYTKLALINQYISNYETAERNYEIAIQKAPGDAFVLNKYADFCIKKGSLTKAESLLKKALKNKKYLSTYANTAELNLQKGNLKQAEKELNKVLYTNENNFDVLIKSAKLSLNKGQYAYAGKTYKTLIDLYPNNFIAHIAIADFYTLYFSKIQLSKELLNQAYTHYRKAISLKPYRYLPYLKLAGFYRALLKLNHSNIIQPLIYNNQDITPTPKIIFEIAKDSTEKYLHLAYKINKNALGCYSQLINYYHDINQMDSALYYLNIFENTFPESYIKNNALASFYLLLGNNKSAEKILKITIEKYPEYIKSYINLMNLYARNGSVKKAEKIYNKYSDKLKNCVECVYTLAQIKLNANIKGYDALFKRTYNYDKNYQFAKNYIDNLSFIGRGKEYVGKRNIQINFKRIGKIQEKYIIVEKNNKKGVFLLSGKMLIPMNFDEIKLKNGYFLATNKTYTIKYDLKGNKIGK